MFSNATKSLNLYIGNLCLFVCCQWLWVSLIAQCTALYKTDQVHFLRIKFKLRQAHITKDILHPLHHFKCMENNHLKFNGRTVQDCFQVRFKSVEIRNWYCGLHREILALGTMASNCCFNVLNRPWGSENPRSHACLSIRKAPSGGVVYHSALSLKLLYTT